MWKLTAWWCWDSLTKKQETAFYLLKFTCIAFRCSFFQRFWTFFIKVISLYLSFCYHFWKVFFSSIYFNWLLFCIHECYWFLHVIFMSCYLAEFFYSLRFIIGFSRVFPGILSISSANKIVLFFLYQLLWL